MSVRSKTVTLCNYIHILQVYTRSLIYFETVVLRVENILILHRVREYLI